MYTYLRSFHAVAPRRLFLCCSSSKHQSTDATQVKALEARYDVELFSRIGRNVHLTQAGQELFRTTIRLTENEAEAENLPKSFRGYNLVVQITAVGPFPHGHDGRF